MHFYSFNYIFTLLYVSNMSDVTEITKKMKPVQINLEDKEVIGMVKDLLRWKYDEMQEYGRHGQRALIRMLIHEAHVAEVSKREQGAGVAF